MSQSDDPFAPIPEDDLSLDLSEGFQLETRRSTLAREGEALSLNAPVAPAPKESKSYAEKEESVRRQYWTLTRVPVLLILGAFTMSHLWLSSQWVFIDGVNVVFHEAGHFVLSWAGDTVYFLGGTLGQLAWPGGLALYFWFKRRERFAATACAWWFGENLVNIARYMRDAPYEELPLVGGDTHDWNHLFGKWHMLGKAESMANTFRFVGAVVMLGTLGYLVYVTIRPSADELAEGFTADN